MKMSQHEHVISFKALRQKNYILIVYVHNAHVYNNSTEPQGNTNTMTSTPLN